MLLSASEAEKIAQSFKSPFPSFLKVMKRFNISGSYTLVSASIALSLPCDYLLLKYVFCMLIPITRDTKLYYEIWGGNAFNKCIFYGVIMLQQVHFFIGNINVINEDKKGKG